MYGNEFNEPISGTFTGTGNSSAVECYGASVQMVFAGTATVNAQWSLDGGSTWSTLHSFTASEQFNFSAGPNVRAKFRLNCSAHTNDVDYVIQYY